MAGSRRGRLSPRRPAGRAQRRHVSVLFCDLAQSVELASRIDPEDMRDVVHAYLNAFAARIEAEGGFIARYTGDGIMAYFGYPLAREGDPARAVRAALAVAAAAGELAPPHGHRLAVRCGVATGLTVVGDLLGEGAAAERGVFGTPPNLAARLQAVARAGETVICAATGRMVSGLFALEQTDTLELKGFAGAQSAFRVLGRIDAFDPLAIRLAPSRAPFVGRSPEMATLERAWRRACGGQTTFVALTGEAGIGKSRLVYEFQRTLSGTPHFWFEAASDASRTGEAYGVARRLVIDPSRANRLSEARLRELLTLAGIPPETGLPLIAPFIGLGAAASAPAAEDRRRALNDLLVQWIIARTRHRPCVIVIEDVQWADPSTLDLLRNLAGLKLSQPLLVIISARDRNDPALRLPAKLLAVDLKGLDDIAIGGIVRRLAERNLKPARIAALIRRSDGNPLFAEELSLQSTSEASVSAVPETLIGLLTARLDAAGEAAGVARVASVLGRTFDVAVLARLARRRASAIAGSLGALAQAGLMVRSGDTAEFRHALIHEAAYLSLLKEDRRSLHRRAAALMRKASRGDAAARHWRAAGESRHAVDAFRDVARAHVADHSYGEAALAYRAALETLGETPVTAARDMEELELSSALTSVLQITEGYAAPSAVAAAQHARVLAERLGDGSRLFRQITAEWAAASSAGNYAEARELASRAVPLAEANGAPDMLGSAYMMLMTAVYRTGALAQGEAVFRAGQRHFRSAGFLRQAGALPQTFGNAAVNAWLLGEEAMARKRNARVIAYGAKAATPYLRAFAHYMVAMQYVLMDEPALAIEKGSDAMAISDREGFPQFAATSRIVVGRALAMEGRRDGIAMLRAGIDRMAINRSRNGQTMYLTWLAQSEAEAGAMRMAGDAAKAALTINPAERFFRPEVLRVSALVAPPDAARGVLLEAISLADSMGSAWQASRARADLAALDARGVAKRAVRRKA